MMKTIAAAMILALGLGWQGSALAQSRIAEVRTNYEAVMTGGRQIGSLTPQELADIIELDRRIRAQKADTRTPSQRCVNAEMKREGGAVSELQRRAIDMKCREAGD
jgi:hypothetical protein